MFTIGTKPSAVAVHEHSYVLVVGFTINSGNTDADFKPNMMVRLMNDGTVAPISATTQRPLGRVVSNYTGNDKGTVRVAMPFESIVRCYADGAIDEGQNLACSGFDATSGLPKFKVATTGDYVVAQCLTAAGNTTTTGYVGILHQASPVVL